MTNLSYLIAAYALVWAGVFIYLFGLQKKQGRLRNELDALKKTMEEKKG